MPAESEPTPTPAGHRAGWTPDFILQFFKEIVTAVLGIAVVIYTLVLAGSAFAYAGDESKISDAKDILLLVLGLAGVVVGYYFGRVPADARATQAQERADEATVEAQGVRNEAQNAADEPRPHPRPDRRGRRRRRVRVHEPGRDPRGRGRSRPRPQPAPRRGRGAIAEPGAPRSPPNACPAFCRKAREIGVWHIETRRGGLPFSQPAGAGCTISRRSRGRGRRCASVGLHGLAEPGVLWVSLNGHGDDGLDFGLSLRFTQDCRPRIVRPRVEGDIGLR